MIWIYLIRPVSVLYQILMVISQMNKTMLDSQLPWYLHLKIKKYHNNGNIINLFVISMVKLYKIYIKRTNNKFQSSGNILIKMKMKILKQWYKQRKASFQINNIITIHYKTINMEIQLQYYYHRMVLSCL